MKRVLLDTSVYGELIKEVNIANAIIAKGVKIEGRSKRNLLLQLYDSFVSPDHHDLDATGETFQKFQQSGEKARCIGV